MNSSFVLSLLLTVFVTLVAASVRSKGSPSPTYTSSIPLSPSSNAFTRGQVGSSVTVDLWIDIACSDCMNDWPMLTEVWESYGDKVQFNYRVFPLPYHQFAFLLAKSCQVVNNHGSDGDVFNFIDFSFIPSNQGMIYNSVTSNLTYDNILTSVISGWVSNSTSIGSDDYLRYMSTDYQNEPMADYNAEMDARYAFKNAAANGVIGTPTVWVNGVEVDGLDSIEQWDLALAEVLN